MSDEELREILGEDADEILRQIQKDLDWFEALEEFEPDDLEEFE
jgi:hypothetical protein